MILKIYQTGSEQPHWIGHSTHLDLTANVPTPIQIVCDDRSAPSVRFSGMLCVTHSPDGRKSCVNVLLNTPGSPDSSQPTAPSPTPAPARRSLCIPLPLDAVSRLRLSPNDPLRFELRLRDVHIDFAQAASKTAPLRSVRLHQFTVPIPAFSCRAFPNAPLVGAGCPHTACQLALGQ